MLQQVAPSVGPEENARPTSIERHGSGIISHDDACLSSIRIHGFRTSNHPLSQISVYLEHKRTTMAGLRSRVPILCSRSNQNRKIITNLESPIRLVLSFLPPYEGKSVLELGAGQGHFTGELAKKVGKVIALDSVESVVKENESINGHYENVEFMCADVTSPDLNFPAETVNLIFTHALLSNISDKEVKDIAEKLLKWVKVGGYIFFTEPCSHQSEDHKQKSDLEHIREPRFYTKVFKECHMSDASGSSYEFSLVETKSIGAYGDNKINENQIFWIWQKVVKSEDDVDRGFQQFLDNVQYKSSGILRYERIFGYGFVSTGGIGINCNPFM